jgi:hypothetical protein
MTTTLALPTLALLLLDANIIPSAVTTITLVPLIPAHPLWVVSTPMLPAMITTIAHPTLALLPTDAHTLPRFAMTTTIAPMMPVVLGTYRLILITALIPLLCAMITTNAPMTLASTALDVFTNHSLAMITMSAPLTLVPLPLDVPSHLTPTATFASTMVSPDTTVPLLISVPLNVVTFFPTTLLDASSMPTLPAMITMLAPTIPAILQMVIVHSPLLLAMITTLAH